MKNYPVRLWPFCLLLSALCFLHCVRKKEPGVSINYLDQEPPGNSAILFAPGLVSTEGMEHSAPVFSPDGSLVVWTVVPDGFQKPAYTLEMSWNHEKWSAPRRVSFNDSLADDYYPSFSVDGKTLFFSSRRKPDSRVPRGGDIRIWQVPKHPEGWGAPTPLDTTLFNGHEFAHSVSARNTLFFSHGYFSETENGKTGWSLYTAESFDGKFSSPTRLPYNINSMGYEDGPYVSPDERFLIFESERPGGFGNTDLYISFKTPSGAWGDAINMGPRVNSSFFERFARLSPDGKYLFFGSSRLASDKRAGFDLFWISASIINDLENEHKALPTADPVLGREILDALDTGDWGNAEVLLRQWLDRHSRDRDALFNLSRTLKYQRKYAEAEAMLLANETLFPDRTTLHMERAVLNLAKGNKSIAEELLTPLLAEGNEQWNRHIQLAASLFDIGLFQESDTYFEKAMQLSPWAYGFYKRGVDYTSLGENERAFHSLNRAVDLGFASRPHFEADSALKFLHADRRWKTLTKRLTE